MSAWSEELDRLCLELDDVIISCTLTKAESDREFNDGYGSPEGKPFHAWSATRVYFSDEYDGSDFVSWVYRNPEDYVEEEDDEAV